MTICDNRGSSGPSRWMFAFDCVVPFLIVLVLVLVLVLSDDDDDDDDDDDCFFFTTTNPTFDDDDEEEGEVTANIYVAVVVARKEK